jgi:uncharacterized membrane protein YsdA (DUF1294 family)/cold shock CspA family protein
MTDEKGKAATGKITRWDAVKGFGFVTPNNISNRKTTSRIFVHISDFKSRHPQPAVGQEVSYVIGKDKAGRLCGKSVTRATDKAQGRGGSGMPVSALFAVVFVSALVIAWKFSRTPLVIVVIYGTLSVITFLAYAIDKSAAKNDRWRTSESTLHLLALIGGWPGAAAAQNLLRHKSRKHEFREIFWITIVLNLGALVWLHTEYGFSYLQLLTNGFEALLSMLPKIGF